jgi:predicted ATPase
MIRGWTVVMHQQEPQGLAQIREGLETLWATGTRLMQPYLLALLAEAYGAMQQPVTGLAVLAEACTGSVETGEQWYDAELHRLRGRLLAQTGAAPQETEAAYQQALTTARRQQARAWELRAAMSLARLWQQQGKQAEARALLTPVYDWFTEGFDTTDLQEARALLEEIT